MVRLLHLLPVLVASVAAFGQGVAPVVTATGRFEVFDRGRFIGLDDRAPTAIARSGAALLFVDPEGALHRVEQGQVQRQDEGGGMAPLAAAGALFWTRGEALFRSDARTPEQLCAAVGPISTTDSLLVFHDRDRKAVMAWWRGHAIEVAAMDSTSDLAPWVAGTNTLVFHDRSRRRVLLLHRGDLRLLFDSAATAEVSAGGDLVAYWDDHRGVFTVWEKGGTVALEPLRPRRFNAGSGVLAWVSAGGAFKVRRGSRVHPVLDHPPSDLWVLDSLVVFVDGGGLHVVGPDGPERVEPYVPESWWVQGGVLTYLDLDRGIRQWRSGERTVIAPGMATRRFEVHGDVVVWTGTDGVVRCWWGGRTYER